MVQHVEHVFFSGPNPVCQPLFPSQHLTNRVVKLERGKSYFYPAEGLNPNDENSALVHYIQVILMKCWIMVSIHVHSVGVPHKLYGSLGS